MEDGRLLEVGTPHEIYETPATEFAARFIGEKNSLQGRIEAIQEDEQDVRLQDGSTLSVPVNARHPADEGAAVNVFINAEKIRFAGAGEQTGKNAFPGTVQSVMYLGTTIKYTVRLENGESIVHDQQTTREAVRHEKGALYLMLIVTPLFTTEVIRALGFKIILAKHGIINTVLLASGLFDEPLQLIYNDFAIVVALIHSIIPYACLVLIGVLVGIDKSYLEAAKTMGAGRIKTFWHVTLPINIWSLLRTGFSPIVAASSTVVILITLGELVLISRFIGFQTLYK